MNARRVLAAVVLCLISTVSAAAQTFTRYEVAYPGANRTVVTAINDAGTAVGYAELADGSLRAFVLDRGTLTPLGTFGGRSSLANGINASGDVWGTAETADGYSHAFIYRNGTMRRLTPPGFASSSPKKMNLAGQVIGEAWDGIRPVGFLATPTQTSVTVDVIRLDPTQQSTLHDLNNRGEAVGLAYLPGGHYHPILYSAAARYLLDLGTFGGPYGVATDINEVGDVTGYVSDSTNRDVAFVRYADAGVKTSLGVGALSSYGQMINDRGDVAVRVFDGSQNRAYLYRRGGFFQSVEPSGSYLGNIAALTNDGRVFGTYAHRFEWRTELYYCFGSLQCSRQVQFFFKRAFVYHDGISEGLATADTSQLLATHVNGYAAVQMSQTDVRLWDTAISGVVAPLPNTVTSITTQGLNKSGVLVGGYVPPGGTSHAFRYAGNDSLDLNALAGRSGATLKVATLISDSGHIAGNGVFDGLERAFVLVLESDSDGDGIFDRSDNCPGAANADQLDWDGNSIGDACDVNALPVALISQDVVRSGIAAPFSAMNSFDHDGTIVRYEWDFNYDGTFDVMATGRDVSHTYATTGAFVVALAVIDNRGGRTVISQGGVVVEGTPPAVTITSPREGAVYALGQSVTAQYSCTDNVAIATCTPSAAPIVTSSAGSHAYSVTAVDTGGNQATHSVTYSVRATSERQWQGAAPLPIAQYFGNAITLLDGMVLVAGGNDASDVPSAKAFLYDSTANAWSALPDMNSPRADSAAVTLADGRVLIAGGMAGNDRTASVDIFDPATRQWTAAAPMNLPRNRHALTLLGNGKVLATGGYLKHTDPYQSYQRTAEIYDPVANTWTSVGMMAERRVGHSSSLLPDGRVLIVGGADYAEYKATVEYFNPSTNTFTSGPSLAERRYFHSAVTLPDGRILIAGGMNFFKDFSDALIYNPASGQWQSAGVMSRARVYFPMALMADGRVLAAGGYTYYPRSSVAATDVFDPVSNSWKAASGMATPRSLASIAPLKDGGAIVVGGSTNSGITALAEIWNGARFIPTLTIPKVTAPAGQPIEVKVYSNASTPVTLFVDARAYGPQVPSAAGEVIFSNVSTAGMPAQSSVSLSAASDADDVTAEGRVVGVLELTGDVTAPVITETIVGTQHPSGWYTSDVLVTWTVTDPESAVTLSPGCGATSVGAELPGGTVLTCTATSAGGTATKSITIRKDGTAPDIVSVLDGATFERGAIVIADFGCTDAVSVASCSAPIAVHSPIDTSATGEFSFIVIALDAVGNRREKTITYFVAPATNAFYWTPVSATTPQPSARFGHGMVYDRARHKLIVIGGRRPDGTYLNDVWERDSATGAWAEITPASNDRPIGRHNFGIAFDQDRNVVLIYAGRVDGVYSNVNSTGDTWEWNPAARTWRQVSTDPIVTAGFIEPSLAWDPIGRRVIMFGGRPYYGTPHNATTYAFTGTQWTAVTSQGPEARAGAAMSTDTRRNRVVLHGGWNRNSSGQWWVLTDTWEWDGARWTRMDYPGATTPSPRNLPAMVFDESRMVTVLFGGAYNGPFLTPMVNTTWEWNGREWRQRAAIGAPSPRLASMAYDPTMGSILLFGGNDSRADNRSYQLPAGAFGDTYLGAGYETVPLTLEAIAVVVPVGQGATIRATVSAPVSYGSRTVTFDLNRDGVSDASAQTDASGAVSVFFSADRLRALLGQHGVFEFSADVAAEGIFSSAHSIADLLIYRYTPQLTVAGGTFTFDRTPHHATASITGGGVDLGAATVSLRYAPGDDAPIAAGTYVVTATFAGNDQFEPATAQGTVIITPALPVVSWSPRQTLSYRSVLGVSELNAVADVAGAFEYTPPAGTSLALGPQTLTAVFTATDHANYERVTASRSIMVIDDVPPNLVNIAPDLTFQALGPDGAIGSWPPPAAIDEIDGTFAVACSPLSGSTFKLGTTTVTCSARDKAGNDASASFTVTVRDSTAPTVTHMITRDWEFTSSPASITVIARDAVGVKSVFINGVPASLMFGTAQDGRWSATVPIALPVLMGGVLKFNAQAVDEAGNGRASLIEVDNDGIAAAIDKNLSTLADASQYHSDSFLYGSTRGFLIDRSGWSVTVSTAMPGFVKASLAGIGGVARMVLCEGSYKELRLDRAGESATIACSGTTVNVTATVAAPQLELMKQLSETRYERRCYFSGGQYICQDVPYSYYYNVMIVIPQGQTLSTGSPITAAATNTEPITVKLVEVREDGTEVVVGGFALDPGEVADPVVTAGVDGADDRINVRVLSGSVDVTIGGQTQSVTEGQTASLLNDTIPPAIRSITPDRAVLSPPNHRIVPVQLSVLVSDAADAAPVCRVESATSNEPDNGLGDGDTAGDIRVTGPLSLDLRAERSGKGTGRVYTINVACTDRAGNVSRQAATVSVQK